MLAMIRDAKFLAPVELPARVELEARIERGVGGQGAFLGFPVAEHPGSATTHARVRISARCADSVVLRAELVFALIEAPPGAEAALLARRVRIARWMAA